MFFAKCLSLVSRQNRLLSGGMCLCLERSDNLWWEPGSAAHESRRPVLSNPVQFNPLPSNPIQSNPSLSLFILPILSHPILSNHILGNPTVAYPINPSINQSIYPTHSIPIINPSFLFPFILHSIQIRTYFTRSNYKEYVANPTLLHDIHPSINPLTDPSTCPSVLFKHTLFNPPTSHFIPLHPIPPYPKNLPCPLLSRPSEPIVSMTHSHTVGFMGFSGTMNTGK